MAQDANSVGPKAGAGEAHRVGMFEILNEIGRGGMGIVYRARDLRLQRLVALKRPHAELLERPGFHVKFIEEAQTASKIMHPNITTVFEVFEDEEVPWMVMELIDGASLRSLLDGQAPLPIEITLKHAEGLIDALRVAHLYGVLHRDIKPNNILVGGDGRARLSDFGLARARAEIPPTEQFSQATTETKTDGHVVGTRGYMSPEQALGKSLDCRTDIFSLGVVLYEMCTGHRAFPRSDSGEFLDALLHREPLPIPQLNSEIPIEFEEIVRKALAKRRFQRYQSANEMLLDVRALRRRLQSDPNYSASKAGRRWPRWPARRVSAVVVTSFLVMSVAGIVAFQRWRGIRSDETIPPLRPKRITSFPGAKIDPAISPDGNEVAFSLERGVTSDIWLTDVRGGKPLQLTENEAVDINPAWFPDGASIAFTRVTGDRSSVYRSPRLGGGAILMLPNAGHPSISPDGRMIAFSRADPGGFWRIWVAPIDALDRARQVTGKDSGLWDHLNPSWSPDGSTLCYEDFRDLWSVPVGGGTPTPLTRDDPSDQNCGWSADGRHVYFSSLREGVTAIWRLALRGGALARVTLSTGADISPGVSRDGRRLVYSSRIDSYAITLLDTETGSRSSVRQTVFMNSPAIAPDRSAIVYSSTREDAVDLWRLDLADNRPVGEARRLTRQPGSCANPHFSPDGSWVIYHGVIEGQRDIWVVSSEGGTPINLTSNDAVDVQPVWSPDGSRIGFTSDRSGSHEIWVAGIEDGRLAGLGKQLTTTDGIATSPSWSADSTQIAFILYSDQDSDLYVVDVMDPGEPRRLTSGASAASVAWDYLSGDILVKGLWGDLSYTVRAVDPVTGSITPRPIIAPLSSTANMGSLRVSIDGKLVAWVEEEHHSDLWLLEGGQWRF